MTDFFKKISFADNVLKGIGQIMLQENRWTGLFFLIGIFVGSWQCGLGVLLATSAGTAIAMLLKYDKNEINAGLYGFSAALVGVALAFLFQANIWVWLLIILGGALASVLQHFFIVKKIPVFTFPFIVTTWVIFFAFHSYFEPSDMLKTKFVDTDLSDVYTTISGFGEVIFQGSAISGLLFFVGVFLSSPIAALYGLVASLFGAFISQINGEPITNIHMGLFGFNAVLSAIVFAGTKKIDGLWVLICVILTVLIDDFLVDYEILKPVGGVFTFPFVAGTWLTLLIQKIPFVKKYIKEN